MDDADITKEFVIESAENLGRLDQELVELEKRPKDKELLASVFRTIHTIKGTSGMLGFNAVEKVAHLAENLLSQLRSGERELTSALISLILETVDAIKLELNAIENTGSERNVSHDDLQRRLKAACQCAIEVSTAPAAVSERQTATPSQPDASDGEPSAIAIEKEPSQPSAAQNSTAQNTASESTIRVDVGLLDRLMNLVGELVLARNQIVQFSGSQEHSNLNASSQRLDLITTELQEGVMKTRMQPIGVIWNKLPRVVRDMAAAAGKAIAIDMDGADTELDKTIIEAIKDPLTHLVRNCCDHGIEPVSARKQAGKPEQGTISLRAYHEGGQVNIEVSDDGAGIDARKLRQSAIAKGLLRSDQLDRMSERELLELIFMPGLSTAEKVTNISGRGVGMDVVKTNIEKVGGAVDVASQPGVGTTFRLKIPLTLAIIPGLVVTSGDERFVIPQASLLELIGLERDQAKQAIEDLHGTRVYRHRGKLLPVVYLNEVLGLHRGRERDSANIVVLQAEAQQFGLVVDTVNDTQEIVVKPVGKHLKDLDCYAGSTIMGDGKVALILDVVGIARSSNVVSALREQSHADAQDSACAAADRQRLLLFRSGTFPRIAVPLSLVARLEEFPRSVIERSGERVIVQYRGQLLPVAALSRMLGCGSDEEVFEREVVQAVVFTDGKRQVGIAVDEIVDIVEDTIAIKSATGQRGFLGSAVIAGQVADFLDLYSVFQTADPEWSDGPPQAVRPARVLLADESEFSRALVRNYMQLAGHEVMEASDAKRALGILRAEDVDVVASAITNAGGMLDEIAGEADNKHIPVLALTDSGPDAEIDDQLSRRRECKFDRGAVLRSIRDLVKNPAVCARAMSAGR